MPSQPVPRGPHPSAPDSTSGAQGEGRRQAEECPQSVDFMRVCVSSLARPAAETPFGPRESYDCGG